MKSLHHLLAATDLSAPARHAAERAALLASEVGASLSLLHVATLAPLDRLRGLVANTPAGLEQRVLDALREDLDQLAAALRGDQANAPATQIVSGALLPELARHADAVSADMVVLGARGASFMRHLLLGSTAERMLSRASRPMLVVKQAAHERYRSVQVPVDFSASSLPALQVARAVAPKARIVVLHAFEVPFEGKLRYAGADDVAVKLYRVAAEQEARQNMRALFQQAGWADHEAAHLVLHGHPLRRILEQEQEYGSDLVVMGKHGESQMEDMLLGSMTRHVLAQSQCDVLVSI